MNLGKVYVLLLVVCALLIALYCGIVSLKPERKRHVNLKARYDLGSMVTPSPAVSINSSDSRLELGTPVLQQRVDVLRGECQKLRDEGYQFQEIQRSKLRHVLVNDKYKVLYCYIPKVACTNLKRVFLVLTGKMNNTDPLKLKSTDVHMSYSKYLSSLVDYQAAGIQYRLQHYRKVVFVRDPFERILSAFRNKLAQKGNQYFKERFGRKIIKRFRDNPTSRSIEKGDDVAFEEFVKYLVNQKTIKEGYNEHWATFYDLCFPCHIQYDYIGKYETLDADVDTMLKILGVDDLVRFPSRNDSYKASKTEDILPKYFKDVGMDLQRKLASIYYWDYQLFGYDLPENLRDV